MIFIPDLKIILNKLTFKLSHYFHFLECSFVFLHLLTLYKDGRSEFSGILCKCSLSQLGVRHTFTKTQWTVLKQSVHFSVRQGYLDLKQLLTNVLLNYNLQVWFLCDHYVLIYSACMTVKNHTMKFNAKHIHPIVLNIHVKNIDF